MGRIQPLLRCGFKLEGCYEGNTLCPTLCEQGVGFLTTYSVSSKCGDNCETEGFVSLFEKAERSLLLVLRL